MAEGKGAYVVALTAAAGNGGMLSLANPEGCDLIVTRLVVRTSEAAAGATSIDAGIAAGAAVSSDNLIDGQAINALGIVNNIDVKADNAKCAQLWGKDQFLTITKSVGGAGSEVGLKASAYIEYIRV